MGLDQAVSAADVTSEPAPSGRRRPFVGPARLGWWPRLGLAIVAGLATGLAFPPYGWAWLAPIAVATLTVLCRGLRAPRAAWLGLAFGVAFFGLLLRWLTVPGVDAWLVVTLIEAVFLAALGAALALLASTRAWPLWTSMAWLAVEFARSHVPLGGLPWGRLAFALGDTPFAPYASLGGAPLVGFTAVLAAHLLAWALLARTRLWWTRAAAVAAAAAVVGGGLLVPLPTGGERTATVAVVQGNIPTTGGLDFLGRARTVTRYHLDATRELMERVEAGEVPRPQVVLWPENSTDLNPFADAPTRAMVEQARDLVGVPLLIGSMQAGPDPQTQVRNTSILWEPGEPPREVYHKRHPVPFGEYIPFRDFFTQFIGRLEMVPRDQVAGDEPGVFDWGPLRAGVVICFEVVWDGLVRDAVLDGSQLLVVQTNNATFLGTGQSEQQFAATRLRALEHGRTTLVASTSGISGIVAPDGTVVARAPELVRKVLVERVPLRTEPTLATVLGPWPELVFTAGALAGLLLALVRARRERGGATRAGTAA